MADTHLIPKAAPQTEGQDSGPKEGQLSGCWASARAFLGRGLSAHECAISAAQLPFVFRGLVAVRWPVVL